MITPDLLDLIAENPDIIDTLTTEEIDDLTAALAREFESPDMPGRLPHQLPPDDPWFGWLFSAGRGSGKTQTMAADFYEHMTGPPCGAGVPGGHRGAIVGPTLGDVATSCYEGPAGLHRIDRRIDMITRKGGTYIVFPNGAVARAVGGDTAREADRLRAHGNTCRVWVEEAAAIRRLAQVWTQIQLSCRFGPSPRVTMSSTPQNTVAYKRIMKDPNVKVTGGSMDDNIYLTESFKNRVRETFAGTHTEAQEIDGVLVTETPGAMWTPPVIDQKRVNVAGLEVERPRLPVPYGGGTEPYEAWIRRVLKITTVYVGLDPATSGRGDRTGVVVVGGDQPSLHKDRRRHVFALDDRTGMMVPSTIDLGDSPGDEDLPDDIQGWAEVAADAAYRWQADAIVVEQNRLGRTARAVLRGAGFTGAIREVIADDSKLNRATPIRAAWTSRCWLVGQLPILEDDMTSWVPSDGDKPEAPDPDDPAGFSGSPDALDAFVWPARELLGLNKPKNRRKANTTSLTDAMLSGWQSR